MDFYETLKEKYHILEVYYILTSNSTPDRDPGVELLGFIANPAGKIYSMYECFPISGCQGKDFDAENRHFEDVLDFDL